MELVRPSEELLPSYLDFVAEMRDLGETIWDGMVPRPSESAADFVDRLLRAEHQPEPGYVRRSSYWAVAGGAVVGHIVLRRELNADLEQFGGHVGYEVRPSQRRRGIAREMLGLLLREPDARAIGRILLTCAPENVASNKTIVANGGVLARTAFVERVQRQTNYYWIELT
jgi:predicted acetyltransferase